MGGVTILRHAQLVEALVVYYSYLLHIQHMAKLQVVYF